MSVADNLARVRQKIEKAAAKAGRNSAQVKLLAVSKTMPVETIQEAYQGGQRLFAENQVQEWMTKAPNLPEDCEWHLVGRLQTNKVKYLSQKVALIHSLDRVNLLTELEKYALKNGYYWNALVQVNVARDPAKAGLLKEEVADFLDQAVQYPHVKVRGFMTIGALDASLAETRGFFSGNCGNCAIPCRPVNGRGLSLRSCPWE